MRWLSLLLLMLAFQFSWSQKAEKYHFEFAGAKLEKVLADIEKQFDVKYSYADSIVAPKAFKLAAGEYTLAQLNTEIEVQASLAVVKIDNRYYSVYKPDDITKEQLAEIVITGFLSKGISKSGQKFIISPQKVKELPGVTDADILLSLQQLPGVKSPNETATGLHVRGGTPDQNLILWDGIRMYHPGHLFGMISGFNPNVDQTVQYSNKAADPKFGERISSVIDIRTTDDIPDSLQASASINALDADVYVKVPLSKKIGVQLSGRKSYTEWLQTPTFNALAEKVFQNTNFTDFNNENRFEFEDYSGKINFKPNDKNDISVTAIMIDNHLNFNTEAETDSTKIQKMDILNYGSSANWKHRYNFGLQQQLLLYYSGYTFGYNENQQYNDNDFEIFSKMNRIIDSGAELNFNYAINDDLSVDFGYQLSGNDVSHAFNSKTQDLEIVLDQKHLQNITHAGYSNFKYITGTWDFQAGVRYNAFTKLKKNSAEPRAFIQKNFGRHFIWQWSYERKSQILSQIRESAANDLSLENYVWILSDGADYPIQKGSQYTTGFTYKNKSFLLDVDAYYKTIKGITSLSFGFFHELGSEIHPGEGFTKGLDILIQESAPTWRIWATYTYQDSQNKYKGLNDSNYFPISSDTKHAFSISFHKAWNRFSIATGWFWHTGKPYSLLNASNDIASFNTQRLPVYHRMDFSAAYAFHQQKSWKGKAGISILNVYDRHALINREYERDYATFGDIINSNYVVRDYHSLGFTPNIFLRVNF